MAKIFDAKFKSDQFSMQGETAKPAVESAVYLWTHDVYIRACKFLPPKRWMTYIYAFLVLAKRRMPFIYAKVLNGILLDFGKH